MSRTSLCFALLALLAMAAVSEAAFCHKSGYTGVNCKKAMAAKRHLWKVCATDKGIKLTHSMETKCGANHHHHPAKPCSYTVVQKVKDAKEWKLFRSCEHKQPIYKKVFKHSANKKCEFSKICP